MTDKTPLESLDLTEATVQALEAGGVASAEELAALSARGGLTKISRIGAGRAEAIRAALSEAGFGQDDGEDGVVTEGVQDAPDTEDGVELSDDPADGLEGAPPAPRGAPGGQSDPEVAAAVEGGRTTYQGRAAKWRRVRVRVRRADENTRQFWYVREGLGGQVVDALELTFVPAAKTTPVRVYVYADDEAVAKFVEHGGATTFGHRELAVESVVEN